MEQGEKNRGFYEQKLRELARVQALVGDADLIETSLRFITTHPANMVVIPGATRPEQVLSNAGAGAEKLEPSLYEQLLRL